MKYKHTKRSGVLFVFLSIITASIYSIFAMENIRKEVNSYSKKHYIPYFWIWLLGFVTLGLAPICYSASLANEIAKKGKDLGINSPRVSFESFFNWTFFGCLIIVGPWIAFSKMMKLSNKVLSALNERNANAVETKAQIDNGGRNADIAIVKVNAPAAAANSESKNSSLATNPIKSVKSSEVIYEDKDAKPEAPRYIVRFDNERYVLGEFATREEAIVFAKKLQAHSGGDVFVKKG